MLTLRSQSVHVDRLTLITALETNLKAHKKEFKAAMADYKKATKKALQQALERAEKDDFSKVVVNITVPTSHEDDFVNALDMLRMSVDEKIELDSDAFQAYVKNNWPWRKQFELLAASYKG